MSESDCIFCKIVAGTIPCTKIYEDEKVLAFLDIGPISEGHTLVITKEHFTKMDKCNSETLSAVVSVLPRITAAVSQAMQADGYNVLCNNGRAAGQLVEHIHFHIIPRKTGDGVFGRWPSFEYPQGKARELAEKICAKL
ncbi:MAG: HIT family protein [Sedimentisphaerales bacterium]|nr:HIT family protein [Sedimentisphaerales bacterium]